MLSDVGLFENLRQGGAGSVWKEMLSDVAADLKEA